MDERKVCRRCGLAWVDPQAGKAFAATGNDHPTVFECKIALQAELVAERERADKAERVMNIMADKDLGLFILAHSIAAARDASTKEE